MGCVMGGVQISQAIAVLILNLGCKSLACKSLACKALARNDLAGDACLGGFVCCMCEGLCGGKMARNLFPQT